MSPQSRGRAPFRATTGAHGANQTFILARCGQSSWCGPEFRQGRPGRCCRVMGQRARLPEGLKLEQAFAHTLSTKRSLVAAIAIKELVTSYGAGFRR